MQVQNTSSPTKNCFIARKVEIMAFYMPPAGAPYGHQLRRVRSGEFRRPLSAAEVDNMPQATKQTCIEEAKAKIQQREGLMNAAGTDHHKYQDSLERRDAWVDTLRILGGEVDDEFGAVPGAGGRDIPPATNTDAAKKPKSRKDGKRSQITGNNPNLATNSASSSTQGPKIPNGSKKTNRSVPNAAEPVNTNNRLKAAKEASTKPGTVEPQFLLKHVGISPPSVPEAASKLSNDDAGSQLMKAVETKVDNSWGAHANKIAGFVGSLLHSLV